MLIYAFDITNDPTRARDIQWNPLLALANNDNYAYSRWCYDRFGNFTVGKGLNEEDAEAIAKAMDELDTYRDPNVYNTYMEKYHRAAKEEGLIAPHALVVTRLDELAEVRTQLAKRGVKPARKM